MSSERLVRWCGILCMMWLGLSGGEANVSFQASDYIVQALFYKRCSDCLLSVVSTFVDITLLSVHEFGLFQDSKWSESCLNTYNLLSFTQTAVCGGRLRYEQRCNASDDSSSVRKLTTFYLINGMPVGVRFRYSRYSSPKNSIKCFSSAAKMSAHIRICAIAMYTYL